MRRSRSQACRFHGTEEQLLVAKLSLAELGAQLDISDPQAGARSTLDPIPIENI